MTTLSSLSSTSPGLPARAVGDEPSFVDRLLDGLSLSIAERGYRETTVADIVRGARTSKRTFYAHFDSKEACFVELLRRHNERLIDRIRDAVEPAASWRRQIHQAVGAYVEHIESNPAITLSWIREFPAHGAEARPLQRLIMGRLTDTLVELSAGPGFQREGLAPVTRPLALILLGGLRELTALVMEDGQDVRTVTEPALTASMALFGPRPSAQ